MSDAHCSCCHPRPDARDEALDPRLLGELHRACLGAAVGFELNFEESEHMWRVEIRSCAAAERFYTHKGRFDPVMREAIHWVLRFQRLSPEAQAERRPPPPEDLVNALQDKVRGKAADAYLAHNQGVLTDCAGSTPAPATSRQKEMGTMGCSTGEKGGKGTKRGAKGTKKGAPATK